MSMRLSIAALRTCAFAKRKQNNKAQVHFAHIQPCIFALEIDLDIRGLKMPTPQYPFSSKCLGNKKN